MRDVASAGEKLTRACFIDAGFPLRHVARDRPLFEAGVSPISVPVPNRDSCPGMGAGGTQLPTFRAHGWIYFSNKDLEMEAGGIESSRTPA